MFENWSTEATESLNINSLWKHPKGCGINGKVSVNSQQVSFGGLAVKHPALGAKGYRFDPSKRSKLFKRLLSQISGWLTTLNGAPVYTELLKIKVDVKDWQ